MLALDVKSDWKVRWTPTGQPERSEKLLTLQFGKDGAMLEKQAFECIGNLNEHMRQWKLAHLRDDIIFTFPCLRIKLYLKISSRGQR